MTETITSVEGNEDISESSTLTELFDKCLKLYDDIENYSQSTNEKEYQSMLRKAILMTESVTHMVNNLGMFSSNEIIEEVAAANIKFLILPALLGYFNLKLQTDVFSHSFRLDQISLAKEYYVDFLKRCKNYEVPDVEIPEVDSNTECDQMNNSNGLNFQKMSEQREAAVAKYKLTMAMNKKITEMKECIDCFDEERLREYHMLLLKRWIYVVLDDLRAIELEKGVLKMAVEPEANRSYKKPVPVQPLKPIILVRTELQKRVFGAGYPSIPAMTVEEFYRQRYPDADNQHAKPAAMNSLQQMATDPEAANNAKELEDAEEETKLERDDPEFLMKARAFDEWKDENRRGSGNRKNKG